MLLRPTRIASAARRLGVALRRAPLWVEVGVIVAFYVGYAVVQGAAPTDAGGATFEPPGPPSGYIE